MVKVGDSPSGAQAAYSSPAAPKYHTWSGARRSWPPTRSKLNSALTGPPQTISACPWPVISTGIRISLVLTTGIAAIATLVGGGGLGEFIKKGLSAYPLGFSVEQVWTGTLLTMALALVLDALFGIVRRLTIPSGIRN